MKKMVLNSASEGEIELALDIGEAASYDIATDRTNFEVNSFLNIENDFMDERENLLKIDDINRHHQDVSSVLRFLMDDVGGLSEGELSRRTGVPQPTIHRILAGVTPKPRMRSIEKLAVFFDITADQLLGRLPLPSDRIPGTFNSDVRKQNSIPVITTQEVLEWAHLKKPLEKNFGHSFITTEIQSHETCYAMQIDSNSDLLEFRSGAIIIVNQQKTPISGAYVLIYSNKYQKTMIGLYNAEKNLCYLDDFNKKTLLLDEHVQLLGVIVEVRRQFHIEN